MKAIYQISIPFKLVKIPGIKVVIGIFSFKSIDDIFFVLISIGMYDFMSTWCKVLPEYFFFVDKYYSKA